MTRSACMQAYHLHAGCTQRKQLNKAIVRYVFSRWSCWRSFFVRPTRQLKCTCGDASNWDVVFVQISNTCVAALTRKKVQLSLTNRAMLIHKRRADLMLLQVTTAQLSIIISRLSICYGLGL